MFINENYDRALQRIYPTNKTIAKSIDETQKLDLLDLIDFNATNKRGDRYILVVINNNCNFGFATPLKNNYSSIITDASLESLDNNIFKKKTKTN